MRELVEDWRREASGAREEKMFSYAYTLESCADQLEAALSEQDAKLREVADGLADSYTPPQM